MWILKLTFFFCVLPKYVIGLSNKTNMLWDYTASPEDVRNNHIELMKLYMNTSVDPCDDFYEYSCGNWKNADELHSEIRASVAMVLSKKVQQVLKELMEESPEDTNNNKEDFKLFYKSCMDTDLISERGNQAALDFMKTFDGWPIVDSKSSEEYINWLNLSAELALYGEKYILGSYVSYNYEDITQDPVIFIYPSYPYRGRNEDEYENITTFIIGEALSDTILGEITGFEESYKNSFSDAYENPSIITLEELLIEEPNIDWERYLSIVLQKRIHPHQEVTASVGTLKEIGALLSNTSSRIIANFMLYNVMVDLVYEVVNIKATYRGTTTRYEYCAEYTKQYFSESLSKTFIGKYLNENANDRAVQLSKEIREAFSEFIDNIFWADEMTKGIAKEKLNTIDLNVGYTSKDVELNLDYPDMKSEEFFENLMKLKKYTVTARDTRDRSRFFTQFDMAAFYLRDDENTTGNVYVSAAMLQPPLFNNYIPNWSNYGGIGYIMGHELTHGFNVRFIKARENETDSEWWSPESFKEYMIRTLCYKFQYDKYKFEDTENSVDGQKTLAENMSDNGGLKFGYEAYKKWLNNHLDSDENQVNPLLNLSGEQLYFVSFAQTLCNNRNKEENEEYSKYDRHTQPTFRVIGSITNSFDFAKAFQCPIGSAMNPPRKCRF